MGWGDEIIVTGMAVRLQQINRLPVRMLDLSGRARWHEVWKGNPRIAAPSHRGPTQPLVSAAGRRPYVERATKSRWIWRDWVCPVGEIYLSERERAFAARFPGRVLLEPNIKADASPNKDWGWERWRTLAGELIRRGLPVAQLGGRGVRRLDGVELIETPGFREAAAVLALARLAILPEGGLHHAAAALGVPAVVLFGGFISPSQTGYAQHENLFVGGRPCGMRVRCRHCQQAMAELPPSLVLERAQAVLSRQSEARPSVRALCAG